MWEPYEDPACEVCGQNLRRNWNTHGWYCPDCEEREAEQASQDKAALEDASHG